MPGEIALHTADTSNTQFFVTANVPPRKHTVLHLADITNTDFVQTFDRGNTPPRRGFWTYAPPTHTSLLFFKFSTEEKIVLHFADTSNTDLFVVANV